MKVIMMTKKGVGSVRLTQTDDNRYLFFNGIVEVNMETAAALNAVYQAYKGYGFEVKPEKKAAAPKTAPKAEKKVAAPRAKWHFPGGEFNREVYIQTAEAMGFPVWTRGGEKRINASKAAKRQIYLAMGAYYA